MTMTLDDAIDEAPATALCAAATLLRFASEVLMWDTERQSTWVALRAIDEAENNMRGAIHGGDDINVVDSRLSGLRLRLGIAGIRDLINAGCVCDSAVDDGVIEGAESRASRILEAAAKSCYGLAFKAEHGT